MSAWASNTRTACSVESVRSERNAPTTLALLQVSPSGRRGTPSVRKRHGSQSESLLECWGKPCKDGTNCDNPATECGSHPGLSSGIATFTATVRAIVCTASASPREQARFEPIHAAVPVRVALWAPLFVAFAACLDGCKAERSTTNAASATPPALNPAASPSSEPAPRVPLEVATSFGRFAAHDTGATTEWSKDCRVWSPCPPLSAPKPCSAAVRRGD